MNNKDNIETRDLTDRDFYQQACSYFYYHAEQRTTMINYFIAVFAAGLALFGSLIEEYPLASVLIAGFMFVVALLFSNLCFSTSDVLLLFFEVLSGIVLLLLLLILRFSSLFFNSSDRFMCVPPYFCNAFLSSSYFLPPNAFAPIS